MTDATPSDRHGTDASVGRRSTFRRAGALQHGPDGEDLQDRRGVGKRKPHVLLRVQYDGEREELQQFHGQRRVFAILDEMYGRKKNVHGETVLVHDEQRERHVRTTAVVAGTELFGQVRGRVHRDRRADQNLRVSGVLRDAAVQRFQRVRRRRRRADGRRLSGGVVSVPEDRSGGPRRRGGLHATTTNDFVYKIYTRARRDVVRRSSDVSR